MKIVVLDGYVLNPGDLSWKSLEAFGEVVLHNKTEAPEVCERLVDADIAVVNKISMTAELMAALPKLKLIAVTATGVDLIDLPAAKKHGIVVSRVPAYSTDSVAQLIFAFIFHFSRQISSLDTSVRAGHWEQAEAFCYWDAPQIEINAKTIGIIGYGAIGRKVCQVAHAFDMHVYVHTRTIPDIIPEGVHFASLESVLTHADYLVLACPLTLETGNIICEETLAMIKSSAILINTGRGGLVDEVALAEALSSKKIAGAGLDVLRHEPPKNGSVLIGLEQCVVTPHIAWATYEARMRLLTITSENIGAFISGNPQNEIPLP